MYKKVFHLRVTRPYTYVYVLRWEILFSNNYNTHGHGLKSKSYLQPLKC